MPVGVRYGLSVQEFYALNPAKLTRYQPFLIEKVRHEKEEISEVGWTNGLYVSRAISGVLPKGRKYPDTPIEIYAKPDEEEEAQPFTDVDRFKMFAETFNKQFELKSVEDKEPAENKPVEDTDTEERQSGVPEAIGGGNDG